MKPKFKSTGNGLVIIDPIERKRYPLKTDVPVSPTPNEGSQIPYPMDSAISVVATQLLLEENTVIYIRYPDGTLCREVHSGEQISLPKCEYIIDISGPVKVYLYVESSVEIEIDSSQTEISFEKSTEITISARSFHRRPAETIETTAKPTDIMKAISMFGSALKTTTSERSYPTHRGHPPALELADELTIPDSLERPETDIKIEIPPTLRYIFPVTPLAYYLGAEVVSGSTPQLRTDTGYSYPLIGKNRFETTVERILRRLFFFDCIVQTEGESPSSLYARQVIEPIIDFDIGEIYRQPIVNRIETYLEIPFEEIEPKIPEWYSKIRLTPTVDYIEFLPFIADELASVDSVDKHQSKKECEMIGDKSPNEVGTTLTRDRRRSPVIQQHWMNSDGCDTVSTKPLAAFQNSVTQSPREDPLQIEVICNDSDMSDELVTVHSTYSDESITPSNVTVHHNLTTEELRTVFAKESDFLHYIGHIDSDGFRCSNGALNVSNLKAVRTNAFFLNACRSYEQGLKLIEAGSIGGIVTLAEIRNRAAVAAGSTIARLLNSGLPLYAALNILRRITSDEHQYHLLGDGLLSVSPIEIGPPISTEIVNNDPGYEVTVTSYANSRYKPGSIYTPYISDSAPYYLVPGTVTFRDVRKPDLVEFLNMDEAPVIFEGELRWSDEIKTSEL